MPTGADDEEGRVAGYEGRLKLTWTNKSLRLLAHEDGTYEWVPPEHYRVAEGRLLHDVATVGECRSSSDRPVDNLFIRGDALHGLTSLIELPEFAKYYVGEVKPCYIDPPFNTGQAFAHCDDADQVDRWVRLKTGDLPILWRNDGREYNADLIVVDKDGTRWVIEVKSDKDADPEEVVGKSDAAQRWVNHVNADDDVNGNWAYLLVTETDITQAKGSWSALCALGTGG